MQETLLTATDHQKDQQQRTACFVLRGETDSGLSAHQLFASDVSAAIYTAASPSVDTARLILECDHLPSRVAQDLANAIPFLACGEESAVHAFGHSLLKNIEESEHAQLQAISLDEYRHAQYLNALAQCLPSPNLEFPSAMMTRFFKRLLTSNKGIHFARIAALDLAVCQILARITHPTSALAVAPYVVQLLRSIAKDEARHVSLAKSMASRMGLSVIQQELEAQKVQTDLARLLEILQPTLKRLAGEKETSVA